MRAAEINSDSIVINYVEVSGFGGSYIDPLDSVMGSFWNGSSFVNPVAPTPPLSDNASLITQSYNASLQRKAEQLEQQGKTFEAVQLLLKAQGV